MAASRAGAATTCTAYPPAPFCGPTKQRFIAAGKQPHRQSHKESKLKSSLPALPQEKQRERYARTGPNTRCRSRKGRVGRKQREKTS